MQLVGSQGLLPGDSPVFSVARVPGEEILPGPTQSSWPPSPDSTYPTQNPPELRPHQSLTLDLRGLHLQTAPPGTTYPDLTPRPHHPQLPPNPHTLPQPQASPRPQPP